jgi:predicted transcriptional regulator
VKRTVVAWDPEWVRKERQSQGLTVDALAKSAELPNTVVASVETRRQCRLSNVVPVLRALGKSREDLRRRWGES